MTRIIARVEGGTPRTLGKKWHERLERDAKGVLRAYTQLSPEDRKILRADARAITRAVDGKE